MSIDVNKAYECYKIGSYTNQQAMEKNTSIAQQLLGLKKALKNKSPAQTWQHSIQFYRAHQPTLSNHQILKIIKLALKPLMSTARRSCRLLGRLAGKGAGEDGVGVAMGQAREKLGVMGNVGDCYGVVLQCMLGGSDPVFFKMLHRPDFRARVSAKEMMFQPAQLAHEPPIARTIIEHELSGFLHAMCEMSLIFCSFSLLCDSQSQSAAYIVQTDTYLSAIVQSSYKFATFRLQLEILKLNYMAIYQKSDPFGLRFHIPLQILSAMYKNGRKWDSRRIRHYSKMLNTYLMLSIANINRISPMQQNLNIETQIYILVKQTLRLGGQLGIQISKQYRKFYHNYVELYEQRLSITLRWSQQLVRAFSYGSLRQMALEDRSERAGKDTKDEEIGQNGRSREQGQIGRRGQSVLGKKVSRAGTDVSAGMGRHHYEGHKIHELYQKITEHFDIIEESDSGDEGHEFERERNQQIMQMDQQMQQVHQSRISQVNARYPKNTTQSVEKLKLQAFQHRQQFEGRLHNLNQMTQRFNRSSSLAILSLSRRKDPAASKIPMNSSLQEDRINKNKMESQFLGHVVRNYRHKSQHHAKEGEKKSDSFLPLVSKQHGPEPEKQKQVQSILVSQKYHKMSRTLFLGNFPKQKVLVL